MPFFSDDRFRSFVKESINRSDPSEGWEFYLKNADFTIYRRHAHDRNPGLYQYRSFGGWKDIKADTLAHVYLDLEFRKKWDKNMQSHNYFVVENSNQSGNHFEIKYPWPLSNRDYAYTIERKVVRDDKGKEHQVILGESLPATSFPEQKNVIRIDTYMQDICITASEDGKGCLVFMDYFDDPKGNIPKSVINWAAKTGVPTFISSLKNACMKYENEHPEGVPLDTTDIIDLY